MNTRIKWVDGIKGIACIIVLLSHSVECIFPAIYFGDSYKYHTSFEYFIHSTPLVIFFNGTAMVGIFFFLSGYLIGKRDYKDNIVIRLYKKYLKYVPMIIIGILIPFIVMKCGLTYHIRLSDIAYSSQFTLNYNNFIPTVMGNGGVILDIFVKSLTKSSTYNATLWFMVVLFWGGTLTESIVSKVKSNRVKLAVLIVLYFLCFIFGDKIDWKIPYGCFIFAGAILSIIQERFNISSSNVISCILFFIGLFFIAPVENVGCFKILNYISFMGINRRIIGAALIVFSISVNNMLQRIMSWKPFVFLSKYSFGIYVTHWGMIISISCGVTYGLYYVGCGYVVSGVIGIIVGLITSIISSVVFTNYFYKLYCDKVISVLTKIGHNSKNRSLENEK